MSILPFHNLIFSKDFFALWFVIAWSIIPGNCFLSTWQLLFHFYEENIVLLLFFIGSHSFNKPRSLFFNEFPAVGSSNLTHISSSKGLLGLLKLIYSIVPMESLISLSTTLILIVRRNRTPTQVFKMIRKFAVWERLRLSGSFMFQVPVSTSFDESSALIKILHCLVILLPLYFPL